MKIDLNDTNDFTLENIAKMIASKDDSVHRQLRVDTAGIAFISDEVGNINTSGLCFRLETWCAGNDYVGKNASQDEEWVKKVFKVLKDNWPNPSNSLIEIY